MKTEEILEAESYFEEMLRGVDSSLLDEWEKMRNPDFVATAEVPEIEQKAIPFTRNRTAFTKMVRNRIFDFVKELSRDMPQTALSLVESDWTIPQLQETLDSFSADHGRIRLDPEARNAKHCRIEKSDDDRMWKIEQVLVDFEDLNDWSLHFEVDLNRCDEAKDVILQFSRLDPIAE